MFLHRRDPAAETTSDADRQQTAGSADHTDMNQMNVSCG